MKPLMILLLQLLFWGGLLMLLFSPHTAVPMLVAALILFLALQQ